MNMHKNIFSVAVTSIALSTPTFADTPIEMAYIFVTGHPSAHAAPVARTEPAVMDIDDIQFAIELARTEGNTVPMIATSSSRAAAKITQRQPQINTAAQSRQFRTFLNELAKSEG